LFVVAAATAVEVQKKRKWNMWAKPWILQRPVAGAYKWINVGGSSAPVRGNIYADKSIV